MVLPYQYHQKLREATQKQKNQSLQSSSLDILRDKPFWIWDKEEHLKAAVETNQNCCFQHIVGLPKKGEREYPLFDYQKTIYDSLMVPSANFSEGFKDKHLYLLKSTGIGASELFLRLMAWLCVKDDTYRNSQMVIVTGPNLDLATKLVKRLKAIFYPKLGIIFDDKETVLNLNGCEISAYPSNHIDSFRSLTNPAFILLDESDMFRKSEQEDVRHVSERYIGKSDPYIVLVSTPNMPGSLMENIKRESEDTCIYKRLYLDYHYGLNKIYSSEEIEKAKMSPSFDREYCLKFSGRIGNLLSSKVIDYAVEQGERLKDLEPNPYTIHSLGVDPAFGSSSFALVLTELTEHNIIKVLSAEEYNDHPNPNDMVERIFEIHRKFHNLWIPIDAANRGFITSLKIAFGESISYAKPEDVSPSNNKVLPVNFSTEHKSMITHLVALFEDHKVAVSQEHDKLIIALKTAQVQEFNLLKDETAHDDLLDALRLSLRCYKIQ
jgi:hypothetical protein